MASQHLREPDHVTEHPVGVTQLAERQMLEPGALVRDVLVEVLTLALLRPQPFLSGVATFTSRDCSACTDARFALRKISIKHPSPARTLALVQSPPPGSTHFIIQFDPLAYH